MLKFTYKLYYNRLSKNIFAGDDSGPVLGAGQKEEKGRAGSEGSGREEQRKTRHRPGPMNSYFFLKIPFATPYKYVMLWQFCLYHALELC